MIEADAKTLPESQAVKQAVDLTQPKSEPLSERNDAQVVNPIWNQVEEAMQAPVCRKCQMPCTVTALVNKSKGEPRNHVVCKGCNSAATMLSRNLGTWPVPSFKGLSQDQQIAFWKSCNDIIQKQGRLDYGSIRASLMITLEKKQYEIAKAEFTSKFLPLSVWIQKGYQEEDIRKGEKEDHPLLGETFAIPLKTVSKAYVAEKVENMIASFEGQVRKRKAECHLQLARGKSSRTLEDGAADAGSEQALEELAWMPTESPGKAKLQTQDEDNKHPEEAEEMTEKEKKRKEAQLKRHNTQVTKLAQKGLDTLTSLQKTFIQHLANKHMLPMQAVEDLEKVGEELTLMTAECQEGLKTLQPGQMKENLRFDAKSLASTVKEMKGVFSQCERMHKLFSKAKK